MAYLYRHIRLDKNQPFYIGIGSDDETFKRAHERSRRNNHWRNVVNVTSYEVEIIMTDLTWEEACEKEKEFISFYGRRDLGSGELVNFTDGGQGLYNPNEETRLRKSLAMKGKNAGDANGMKKPEARLKASTSRRGKYKGAESPVSCPVNCYDMSGNYLKSYDSIAAAEQDTGAANPNIVKVCKGLRNSAGNYIWKYKN